MGNETDYKSAGVEINEADIFIGVVAECAFDLCFLNFEEISLNNF